MDGKTNWWDAGEFTFFRLPRAIMENEKYAGLSGDAKILYALMVNRLSLSEANGWRDGAGEVFLYFTNGEICKTLGCSAGTATRLLRSLEGCGLIRRVRQGLGRPDRILLRAPEGMTKAATGNGKKRDPEIAKRRTPESQNLTSRKKEKRKKEKRKIDSILTAPVTEVADAAPAARAPREVIKEKFLLCSSGDGALLAELEDLMRDVCGDPSPVVRVGGEVRSREAVRRQLLALDTGQISAVAEQVAQGTVPRRRPELLAALCRDA